MNIVDYLLGSGPMFLGHAPPEVIAAVQAQIPLGTTFFANNEHGIRLAEEIVDALPCAEQVRFVSTGSEADMYAMRVARAFRQRDQHPEVRGRLPRHERLGADEPRAEAAGEFPARRAGLRRHPEKRAGGDAGRPLQRPGGRPQPDRRAP